MHKSDTLYDDKTRSLFEFSDETLARSRALTEQFIIQSEFLRVLNEQSTRAIQLWRITIGEINKTKSKIPR